MSAEGAAGGLLIIGGSPGRREDDIGRPFMSESSVFFRKLVERSWSGPVAYDYAVRCCPGPSEAMVHAPMCRRYLAATFGEVQPSRVLLLGRLAALAVTGRSPSPLTVRGGYTWLAGDKPVFFLQDPADATRNRFHRQWMEEDVRVALPGADTMSMPPWRQAGHVVETAEDAQEAATALRSAPWFAFDTETAGKMWRGPFQVLCLACSAASSDTSWIWGPAALANPDVLSPLVQLLIDPSVAKVGQNIKYDLAALRLGLGISVRGVRDDTRLLRKMLYSDADGSLETMAELIGMGGHKAEAQGALAGACSRVGELARQNEQAGRTLQLDGLGGDIGLLRPEVAGSIRYGDEPLNFAYGLLPEDLLLRYCCRDTISTARLNLLLERQAQADDPGITRVYRQVLMPASDAVHQVERWGMPVSKDAVQQFHTYLTMAKGEMLTRIKSHGGVDPDSTQDIGRFLYKDLGLKVETTTPTGKPSTSAEALEDMRDAHPVVGEILDYRRLVYLDGNHAAGLLPHICLDGRIHPTLLLDGARTGRMSCVRGGTLIEVVRDVSKFPKGVPVEDVRVGDLAYCYTDAGKLTIRKVLRAWCSGRRRLLRLHWMGTGHHHRGHLDLTPDHRIRLISGGWLRADELKPGDRVFALARGTSLGYARLWPSNAPEVTREHRFIFEQVCGQSFEHVHHRNGNKLDNRLENLVGLSAHDHLSGHADHLTDALRARRSQLLRERWQRGEIRVRRGAESAGWLGLTRGQIEPLLQSCAWSVTNAARSGGYDFDTFKFYVVAAGYDLKELRRLNRAGRREQILASAAHARSACLGRNHSILFVEELPDADDVYDLSIEGASCFIAGEILVHNCSRPNLHGTPRDADSPEGKMARQCFAAGEGKRIISADYSQLELRVAAMLSGDPVMTDIFRLGGDIHLSTAKAISQLVWGVPPSAVEKRHRSAAKAFVFGVIYGLGDKGIAARAGCTVAEARKIRAAIMGRFKVLAEWVTARLDETRRTGEAWTWWEGARGRRRCMEGIADPNDDRRIVYEHGAYNTPIQGTGSEYLVASLSAIVEWVRDNGVPAVVCVPVHDSVILEVEESAVDEVAANVKRIMLSWDSGDVPLGVDVDVGPTWGDLQKWVGSARPAQVHGQGETT